jgi:hypothetical protein
MLPSLRVLHLDTPGGPPTIPWQGLTTLHVHHSLYRSDFISILREFREQLVDAFFGWLRADGGPHLAQPVVVLPALSSLQMMIPGPEMLIAAYLDRLFAPSLKRFVLRSLTRDLHEKFQDLALALGGFLERSAARLTHLQLSSSSISQTNLVQILSITTDLTHLNLSQETDQTTFLNWFGDINLNPPPLPNLQSLILNGHIVPSGFVPEKITSRLKNPRVTRLKYLHAPPEYLRLEDLDELYSAAEN